MANAFLHCESRKVDKTGCISFDGKKYEVGLVFTGYRVDVIFDPADKSFVTIEHDNHTSFTAKELVIGEFTGKTQTPGLYNRSPGQ
ncbi:Mu transposase C-terminal domain-containing protein [Acetobacterium sp.]|uniref:Mu transposase C-terminal domain-containing protein n=1 Tax=Acetobacterium sp. TaxID=1872094 RepID=UPI0035940C90